MDCSPPSFSAHEIFQTTILEWVFIPFSRRSSRLRDLTQVSCNGRGILYHWTICEAHICINMWYLFFSDLHHSVWQTLSSPSVQFSWVAQSCPTLCDTMDCITPGLCPSPTPAVYSNACPLSPWWHPTISSSVVPFSSCLKSLTASGSFPMSQFFTSGGQRIGILASASVLPMNTQDWSPLGWTVWISLQSKGLSRVLSNTTVQKHQFFGS